MTGATLSLLAAFFWACGVILFRVSGKSLSPISLNIFKSLVAFFLISATMLILGIEFFPDKPTSEWLWLALSGVIGITLADLFFFMALNRLGAGLTAIVECLYLPCVIFFSFLLLSEPLSLAAVIGGLLVLSAVLIGSIQPRGISFQAGSTGIPWFGLLIGSLSMICVAAGIVIIKEILAETNVYWATLVRVTAGVLSLSAIAVFHPEQNQIINELKFSRSWAVALPAAFFGNYLALLCWVGGMKYTTASKAAILNQMSSIFIFILAALFLKEKITLNRVFAISLALIGAGLTILAT